jgi:hypothetical protein
VGPGVPEPRFRARRRRADAVRAVPVVHHGSLIRNTGFVGAGSLLDEHFPQVERYAAGFQYAVLATIAVAAVLRRTRARR